MSGSAANFLTFSRRLLVVKAKPSIRLSSSTGSRPFAATQRACLSTSARLATRDEGTPHTTDKDSDGALDTQAESSRSGKEEKAQGGGGELSSATSERDPGGSSRKVKEEFPEAPPGPVIGMQDDKGGKGLK